MDDKFLHVKKMDKPTLPLPVASSKACSPSSWIISFPSCVYYNKEIKPNLGDNQL